MVSLENKNLYLCIILYVFMCVYMRMDHRNLSSLRHGLLHVVQEAVNLGFQCQNVTCVAVLASNKGDYQWQFVHLDHLY